MACAAALAVQQVIQRDALLPQVQRLGHGLRERLVAAFGEHPHVGDIRGRGLFQAIELVARPRHARHRSIPRESCMPASRPKRWRAGLMVYPMGGTLDGVHGDHVLLAPPFITTDAELDADRRAAGVRAVAARAAEPGQSLSPHPCPGTYRAAACPIGAITA